MNDEPPDRTLPNISHEEFEALRHSETNNELHRAILALALTDSDRQYVEAACIELSRHHDEFVRGNAILGLGHLARRFGELAFKCRPIIEGGLVDSSVHVRGQACAAADDVVFFLKWVIAGYPPGVFEGSEDTPEDA